MTFKVDTFCNSVSIILICRVSQTLLHHYPFSHTSKMLILLLVIWLIRWWCCDPPAFVLFKTWTSWFTTDATDSRIRKTRTIKLYYGA